MSTISSASTFEQIKAAYLDNASYLEDVSVSKAHAFVTACTALLIELPRRVSHGGTEELEIDMQSVARALDDAKKWIAANGGKAGTSVSYFSLEDFR